ncbi:MAG: 3-phosphoshikimate 1-carboxyvinyltransferase [Saprospiraceae bacterium]|nr:3-phosphoshikimate 1-carboxyvinyltransferase [Candidatus Brachybacter algidus]
MDYVIINPGRVAGKINAPASKSSMQRACAAALLCGRTSTLLNPGDSNDDRAALSIIKQLGAEVMPFEDAYLIKPLSSFFINSPLEISAGESGLSVRMFTPITSLFDKEIKVKGNGSLLTRPMEGFAEIFNQLGIKYTSNNDKLPVTICGPLVPRNIEIDGSLSSQYLTGILMAYSAAKANDVTIFVHGLKSKPYIDLTLEVLKSFKMKVPQTHDYTSFYFDSSEIETDPEAVTYKVEGDWSGGAFLLVAGAIHGNIEVSGLDLFSAQADSAVMDAVRDSGAILEVENGVIKVSQAPLVAFNFDATECPDLFPPLIALVSFCEGVTRIKGIHRLIHKESDRAATLQNEFGKLGVNIVFEGDEMLITGGQFISGGKVHSCHDHRIAMACAVAGIRADTCVIIEEPFAINKSYPTFYEDLIKLGVEVIIPS